MLRLNRAKDETPLRHKILMKHLSDALPLIREELGPFNAYIPVPKMRIERDQVIRSFHIYASPIKLPTKTEPFVAWAELYLRDDEDVWIDSYERMWMIGHLDDLTAEVVCSAFCHANETELLKSFTALADYHEAQNFLEVPF